MPDEQIDQLSEQERQALIERLRASGLRLDREGQWWHEGARVDHARLAAALHRWIDRLDDGRYVVRLDAERYAYIDVEDAPYVVRTITIEAVARTEGGERILVHLSDGTEETLEASTLRVGYGDVLYCRVKQGRMEARFSRAAYYLLAERIEATAAGYALRVGGELFPVDDPGDRGG